MKLIKPLTLLCALLLFITNCSQTFNASTRKSFPEEDKLIFALIERKNSLDHETSVLILDKLFDQSNKVEYLLDKVQIEAVYLNKYDSAMATLNDLIKKHPKNITFLRNAFDISISQKQYDSALGYAKEILKYSKKSQDYINTANAHILLEQYKEAIPYLEAAYNFDKDENILAKMTTLMYLYENQKEKALSYLETHIRLYSFSEQIAQKLLVIYKENNNVEGLISVYKQLNAKYGKREYADILIQLYILQDKKLELVNFLMDSEIDIVTFVSLFRYIDSKYDRYKIAMQMHKKTGDWNFLAQAAMMEYELSLVPLSKYKLDHAIDKLTQVIEKEASAEYLNYLGYILIKHDTNFDKGIEYVQQALTKEPNSPYYLDSLAWGYYKIKRYEEAYEIMKKVVEKLGKQDKEITFHLESIEKEINKKTQEKQQ